MWKHKSIHFNKKVSAFDFFVMMNDIEIKVRLVGEFHPFVSNIEWQVENDIPVL